MSPREKVRKKDEKALRRLICFGLGEVAYRRGHAWCDLPQTFRQPAPPGEGEPGYRPQWTGGAPERDRVDGYLQYSPVCIRMQQHTGKAR